MGSKAVMTAGEWAVRTTAVGREMLGFAGRPPRFTALHLPEPATGGALVCSPLYAEFLQNYGREVRLSRRLAAEGVASARFHYRGTGDSAGDPAEVTVASLVEDALETADRLREEAGVPRLDVIGTRLSGQVAAEVAARLGGGARLVVWEPVPDPRRYFDEVFRARRMVGVIAQEGEASGTAAMLADLEREGRLDVVGYHVHRALYHSALQATFPTEGLADVLLVQASRTDRIKASIQRLAEAIRAGGGTVQIEVVPPGEGWWIHNYDENTPPDAAQAAARRLVDLTVEWLLRSP